MRSSRRPVCSGWRPPRVSQASLSVSRWQRPPYEARRPWTRSEAPGGWRIEPVPRCPDLERMSPQNHAQLTAQRRGRVAQRQA
eukprot:scaffold199666_cov24-Tisochrysis_lutea.AAC.4